MVDTAWEDTEDMVDTVTVLDTGATVTIMARDPLMPNLKLMLDICMADMGMEDMEAMDVDTAMVDVMADMVAFMVDMDTEDMVDIGTMDMVTITERDPLMLNLKLMLDICMEDTGMVDMEDMDMVPMAVDTDIALDTMEDMVDMVLDTEDMAVSGDKHSQVVQPTSSRNCQTSIKPKNCSNISQPLIQYQCLTFVKSRIYRESKSIYCFHKYDFNKT